jgi:hydroxypyruvate isomerase
MTRFSANLGFLWTDRALPDAIRAAKTAGFDAVECHWPYDVPPGAVKAALKETQLRMLGLNTRRGDVAAGDNGLAAIPGRQAEARAMIELAIDYAVEIDADNIHVMAGYAEGTEARRTFIDTLIWACDKAARHGLTILIEPLNAYDAPGYFLQTTQQAAKIIKDVGAKNLKLMFDCYHVGRTEGDVIAQLKQRLSITGHIQFASVPDRGTPDHGDVDYRAVFSLLDDMGWDSPLGAEYKPQSATEASLAWMSVLR